MTVSISTNITREKLVQKKNHYIHKLKQKIMYIAIYKWYDKTFDKLYTGVEAFLNASLLQGEQQFINLN